MNDMKFTVGRVREAAPMSYGADTASAGQTAEEDRIIAQAMGILEARMKRERFRITSPETAVQYLRLRLSDLAHEVFGCVFLDNKHFVLEAVELFRGTIDGANVHTREILRETLSRNAAAVLIYHNHPSGDATPSAADLEVTQKVRDALALVDVRLLDHLVIGDKVASFAERNLI